MAYRIYLTIKALKKAIQHTFNSLSQTPYVEKGGFLIGAKNDNEQKIYLFDSCEAPYAKCYAASMNITPDDWAFADKYCEKYSTTERPCRPFGWYHSHPRYGVFMSPYDSFIQQHFFNRPWNVALVIDPTIHSLGVFAWNQKLAQVEPLSFEFVEFNSTGNKPSNSIFLKINDKIWDCEYRCRIVEGDPTPVSSQIESYLLPIRPGVRRKFNILKKVTMDNLDIEMLRDAQVLYSNE